MVAVLDCDRLAVMLRRTHQWRQREDSMDKSELIDRLGEGTISRRDLKKAMAAAGVAAVTMPLPRRARADGALEAMRRRWPLATPRPDADGTGRLVDQAFGWRRRAPVAAPAGDQLPASGVGGPAADSAGCRGVLWRRGVGGGRGREPESDRVPGALPPGDPPHGTVSRLRLGPRTQAGDARLGCPRGSGPTRPDCRLVPLRGAW